MAAQPGGIAATVEANRAGVSPKLVAEHVTLVGDLVENLLASLDTLTPASLAALINAEHRFAVITAEEDQHLTAAGLEQSMPAGCGGDDPWARYRAAGLDPATFRPLPPEVASIAHRLSTPAGRRAYQRRQGADEPAEAAVAVALADTDVTGDD